jgi:hypothetical protein
MAWLCRDKHLLCTLAISRDTEPRTVGCEGITSRKGSKTGNQNAARPQEGKGE